MRSIHDGGATKLTAFRVWPEVDAGGESALPGVHGRGEFFFFAGWTLPIGLLGVPPLIALFDSTAE
jgi:hypothetical protein